MRDPSISSGTAYVLFAYDVAMGIRLEEITALLLGESRKWARDETQPTPRYLDFKNPPLKLLQSIEPMQVGPRHTAGEVEARVFDFGAISLTYRFPLQGPLSELVAFSDELYENVVLLADSRERVNHLLESIAPAVSRARISAFVEDYVVFQIERLGGAEPAEPARVVEANRDLLAGVLRSEMRRLSTQEIDDALGARISYAAGEEAVIDWNRAILFQEDVADARTVLEYANVELLEMRWLDDQLDRVLDRSYETSVRSAQRRWRRSFPLIPHREIREVARLQTDSALLLEGVTNALKFVGDPYLGRLYRLAAARMHLADWDASIERKLRTVESIYQKLSDQASTRRLEALEWIIIALIAFSTLTIFF